MATTRKKKEVVEKVAKPAAKKAPTKKQTTPTEPVVVKGNHLTVITYPDGRTELEWDDEALLREVQDAIKAHEAAELVGSVALGNKPSTRTRAKKNV